MTGPDGDAPVICDIVTRDPDGATDEDMANGHLIAAAPDLLDALEAYYGRHKCGCGHPACNDCERDRVAEAALAKARGETP